MRRVSCITPFTSCMSNYWVQTKAQWSQSTLSTPPRTAALTHTHGRRWVTESRNSNLPGLKGRDFNVSLHVSVLVCRCHMCSLAMELGWDTSISCTDWRTCSWLSSPPRCSPTAQWLSDQPKPAPRLNPPKKCNADIIANTLNPTSMINTYLL